MKFWTIVILVSLLSCAGSYRRPESFESKMARFQPKNSNPNQVPSYEVSSQFKVSKGKTNLKARTPASVVDQTELPSTKRLYFLNLYGQYRELGHYLERNLPPELNHCASFHTTLLNYNGRLRSKADRKNFEWAKRFNQLTPDMVRTHHELSLPVTYDDTKPRLYDVIKENKSNETRKEYFQSALEIHLTKTYRELVELCEYGSSDNYYSYQNLWTHIKREGQSFTPSHESLKILMKTTVFSNMALISSLKKKQTKGRMPASKYKNKGNFYQEGLLNDLGVQWSKEYLKSLK